MIKLDLFADKSLLLEGLDLVTAIASYYYLAFVFQLHYAKEVSNCEENILTLKWNLHSFQSSSVAHIIQEKVARYGDVENGVDMTSNSTSNVTKNNLAKFYKTIGEAVCD